MCTIRPPAPEESRIVAELVLQSDCGLLPALFGPRVKDLVASLQASRRNPYAGGNTLVVVGDTGAVVGALVGSRADAARRSELPTAALLLRWYGPAVLGRLPRLGRAGKALADLAPDDYYLSHIAVLPAWQGRGTGRDVLRAGEERARQQGARRVVLDVEEHNDRARAFYAREGYEQASRVLIDLGKSGAFAFRRLAKDLGDPPTPPVGG
jgi:ribosomal protein S18 acetylase RimI-like enzyme